MKNSKPSYSVRPAEERDLLAISEIYNREILHSNANYETKAQTVEERKAWFKNLMEKNFPVLVCLLQEDVVGFAALTPFHPLSGYRFTVTGSVYVKAGFRKTGVGKLLLTELKKCASEIGIHCVIAGVHSKNSASLSLLKSFGFHEVGYFKEIGFKNGTWHDDVCLQLLL